MHSLQHVEAGHMGIALHPAQTLGGPIGHLSNVLNAIQGLEPPAGPKAITQPSEYQIDRITAVDSGDLSRYQNAVLSIDGKGKGHFTFGDGQEIPITSAGTTGVEGDHIVFQSLNQAVSGAFSFAPGANEGEAALIDHATHVKASAHKGRSL
jgi:hypothetical protein